MKKSALTISLVFLYIMIEIAFRSEMISFVSSVMHYGEVFFIEFSGRFIASLGFSLFIYQIVANKKNVRSKFLIVISSFLLFFVVEKMIINGIVSSLSQEDRVKAVLLSNYKDSIILNIKSNKHISETSSEETKRTRVAFIPISNINNKDLLSDLKNSSSKDVFSVFSKKGVVFNKINTLSYKRTLRDVEKTYYDVIGVRNAVAGFWAQHGASLRKVFPYAVKNVVERYNIDKNGYLGFKYPTMSKFLSSDEARGIIIGHSSIAKLMGYSSIPVEIHNCLISKPWSANDFDGMVRYSKECASDSVAADINEKLYDNGIVIKNKRLDIFKNSFSSLFSQPYFIEVLGYTAPFLISPDGGVYDINNFKNENSVLRISGGVAKNQTKDVLYIVKNPEVIDSNAKYKAISDSYSKALIIPPFMILVSTIMIIVNVMKLFMTISSELYTRKSKFFITFILLSWVASVPFIFMGNGDKRMNGESDAIMYARLWSENTSESMFLINHKNQPFRMALDGLILTNIIVQKYEIPILSSGAIDDYAYRFVADNHARRIGVIK